MHKSDKSNRNFILFWIISILFLALWYVFWQARTKNVFGNLNLKSGFLDLIPMDAERREKLKTVGYFADYMLEEDGREKTFLILISEQYGNPSRRGIYRIFRNRQNEKWKSFRNTNP